MAEKSCAVEEDRWEGGPEKEWIRKGRDWLGSWPGLRGEGKVGLGWEGDNNVERGRMYPVVFINSCSWKVCCRRTMVGCAAADAEQREKV